MKITKISKLDTDQQRYDFTVEENENFFLNGVLVHNCRALATKVSDDHIEFTSRMGKVLENLGHIERELLPIMLVDEVFDGEMYIHGKPLQEIASAIKKVGPFTQSIEYWIYDLADPTLPFAKRGVIAESHLSYCKTGKVKFVETHWVQSEDEIKEWHEKFIEAGFEGTMIRNAMGHYVFKHRSSDLLKMKDFCDAEFKVVDVKTGVSGTKFDGVAIWTCATHEGKLFDVVCKGTLDEKKEQYASKNKYLGRLLTVKYQTLSNDGIPIFPVGLSFREDFDL